MAGLDSYAKLLNEQGGIGGRRVRVISYDDRLDPTQVLTNVKRFVERDQVFAIFSLWSDSALEYVTQKGVPVLTMGVTAPPYSSKYPTVVPLQANVLTWNQQLAEAVTQHMNIKPKRIGIIYDTTLFDERPYLPYFKETWAEFGAEVVALEPMNLSDGDCTSIALKMRSAEVDFWNFETLAWPLCITAMDRIGWKPPLGMGGWPASAAGVGNIVGPSVAGIIAMNIADQPDGSPRVKNAAHDEYAKTVAKYYPKMNNQGALESSATLGYYTGMRLFADALKAIGPNYTRQAVLGWLNGVKNYDLGIQPVIKGLAADCKQGTAETWWAPWQWDKQKNEAFRKPATPYVGTGPLRGQVRRPLLRHPDRRQDRRQVGAHPMREADRLGPLHGIRVVEMGTHVAGPFAGQLLGDFGAEVIKVEQPDAGDPMRQWGPVRPQGLSLWWPILARNKKSITVDLRQREGQLLVRRLITETADVLLENFRPGTLEKWGLGPEALQQQRPELIVARVSGYGQTGPYARRAGFGSIGEAMGGIRHVTGFPDRPPARSGVSLGDALAGVFTALGVVMSLLERERGRAATGEGRGQVVDVAIYEAVLTLMESLLPDYQLGDHTRGRSGSVLPNVAPSNLYETADGVMVLIAANADAPFRRLAEVMGQPELADDPRYATHLARGERADELDILIENWTRGFGAAELVDLLAEHGVPAGSSTRPTRCWPTRTSPPGRTSSGTTTRRWASSPCRRPARA